jgi:uncharacterized protein (TIGR02265 family)
MDTRDALSHRVALAAPDARTHGRHYEDILLGLSGMCGPAVAEEVRGLVPGAAGPGSFNYLVADMLHLCGVAADTAERRTGLPYGEAIEKLGAFTARRYLSSTLGKAMWLLANRDIHECLKWSLVSIRAAITYGQRRYERLSPHSARLVFKGELMGPAWMRGIFDSGLHVVTHQRLTISVENMSEPRLEFALHFTW